jgi:PAS domain S-box-containing protein
MAATSTSVAGTFLVVPSNPISRSATAERPSMLHALFDFTPDAVCVLVEGQLIAVNDAFLILFAYEDDAAVLKRGVRDFLSLWPEAGGTVSTTGRRRNESTFDCVVTVKSFNADGLGYELLVIRDTTAQVAAQRTIERDELRLRTILESTLDAVITMDDRGAVIGWNTHAEKIFGWTSKEAVGKRVSELIIPNELRGAHEKGHEHLRRTGHGPVLNKRIEVNGMRRDGTLVPVELLIVPTHVGDEKYYTGFLHDISERRAAEAALRSARDQLEELRQEVERRKAAQEAAERSRLEMVQAEKMIALGTLVGGVAHEINNPNHFIMLNMPLLRDAWQDALPILDAHADQDTGFRLANVPYRRMRDEVTKLISEVHKGAERIKRIVDELRSYSRQQSHGSMGPVNVNDVVDSALLLLASPIRQATNHFVVTLGKSLPMTFGNGGRLEQVVINLIQNACQALTDRDRKVEVRTSYDATSNCVLIDVIDEGKGIRPEDLPHVTDPFFTTKRDVGGTGLGLAVSARIVAEHNATLDFASAVGKGTTARLTLPVMEIASNG